MGVIDVPDCIDWCFMPGEYLDLTSEPDPPARPAARGTERGPAESASAASRRYIGIHFACCDVYSRIYVNRQQTAYTGHCPRCSKRLDIKIGAGGTDARFFTAY
ncbi:MAG: hypothetical protein SGJ20_12030 [Planctomycetota bacterium]|nr:hypothetical protein [Planctomycetota bacterium]